MQNKKHKLPQKHTNFTTPARENRVPSTQIELNPRFFNGDQNAFPTVSMVGGLNTSQSHATQFGERFEIPPDTRTQVKVSVQNAAFL